MSSQKSENLYIAYKSGDDLHEYHENLVPQDIFREANEDKAIQDLTGEQVVEEEIKNHVRKNVDFEEKDLESYYDDYEEVWRKLTKSGRVNPPGFGRIGSEELLQEMEGLFRFRLMYLGSFYHALWKTQSTKAWKLLCT